MVKTISSLTPEAVVELQELLDSFDVPREAVVVLEQR